MKFAISSQSRHDHEASTVVWYCSINNLEYRVVGHPSDVQPGFVPVGNVQWVTSVLGRPIVPDYYPKFLFGLLYRKVWQEDKWPYGRRVFIKPSDTHKRFTGFVTTGTWKGKKKPPYWCSDVVQFTTEWRWYVCCGKVYATRYGSGVEAPPPSLDIAWPADYSGAVDFGLLSTGEVALIESNAPGIATGWYGTISEGAAYVNWLAACWQHLQSSGS